MNNTCYFVPESKINGIKKNKGYEKNNYYFIIDRSGLV